MYLHATLFHPILALPVPIAAGALPPRLGPLLQTLPLLPIPAQILVQLDILLLPPCQLAIALPQDLLQLRDPFCGLLVGVWAAAGGFAGADFGCAERTGGGLVVVVVVGGGGEGADGVGERCAGGLGGGFEDVEAFGELVDGLFEVGVC